jgi:hypothetical protein
MHGRGEKPVQGFGGKPKGKRPFEKPKRKWEDGLKKNLRESGWEGGMDSSGSG